MPTVSKPGSARTMARLAVGLGMLLLILPSVMQGQPPGPGSNATLTAVPTVLPKPPTPLVGSLQPKNDKKNGVNGNGKDADTRPVLTLGECVSIALERQPSMKAVQASASSSAAGQRALHNIPPRIGELLSPDLPIRKEQSARGQIAAAADIQKIHNEIVYDATRLYYTIVYAHQQEQIADNVVATLDRLVMIAEDILKSPMPGDMTKLKLDMMKIGLGEAKSLRLTAIQGQKQGYAALREVLGVEPSFAFRVQDTGLPVMAQDVQFTPEQAIEMALARRPELTLAAAGVDAFRLEVYAQAKIPFKKTVPTLASGADIHARQIPQGSRDKDYRPEAIVPEMPPQLVGSKYDRVCRAMAYSQRADAVYEKARNLIMLEAENGFYLLELAAQKLVIAKQKNEDAKDLMDRVLENIDNLKSQKDQLVMGYVTASRAQSDYVTAVYDYILALAAMERITAGGVRPSFPGR